MRVLSLDCWWNESSVDYYAFRDPVSVFDYGVVIWDPMNTPGTYGVEPFRETFQGVRQISEDESPRFMSDLSRRKQEFLQFVEMGRALVVFMAPNVIVSVHTGERETSGTGKNRHVTKIVESVDLLSALPVEGEFFPGVGYEIAARDNEFGRLLSKYSERWCYRAILEKYPGRPLAVVKGTDKVVSAVTHNDRDGMVLMLPDFVDPEVEDVDAEEENADGGSQVDEDIEDLLRWIKDLHSPSEELPRWVENFSFVEDLLRAEEIRQLEKRRQQLLLEIDKKKLEQAESDDWKLLFTAQGATLEHQVALAFEVLGFEVERGEKGRTDLRIKWQGKKAVVEVKGVGKSASEKNAAQLEKWASEETISSGMPPKGVLVVNAWKNLPPDERVQPAFPEQMLPFSVNRGHCLITGLQLLAMVRACKSDPSERDAICASIMETVGTVDGWDDLDQIFVAAERSELAEADSAEV